jgi:trk system potassium uptake protein TrkA
MVNREDEVFIPRGDFIIKEGDYIHIIGADNDIIAFCKKLKIFKPRAKNAFIVGGGKIAYYLAKNLIENKIDVKILENNLERANELSSELERAIVLCGDGTDHEVLEEEGFKNNDAFISLTGMDEENVIISLLAKRSGISKVITKVDRDPIYDMMEKLGLETVVSPKDIIANHIVSFVRAHQAETGNGVNTLYKLIKTRYYK